MDQYIVYKRKFYASSLNMDELCAMTSMNLTNLALNESSNNHKITYE